MHKSHATYGPISRARYDSYQILIYNALLVSRRRLNKERVSVKADNPFDLLLPAAMAKVAEEAGVYKATKHPLKTFYLAITAGVFISIAFVFILLRQPVLARCLMAWRNLSGYLFLFGTDSLCYLRR